MISLDAVKDLDCVSSFSPLTFDLSAREVTGADAVLRRILYRWCTRRGTLAWGTGVGVNRPVHDLGGTVFSSRDLLGLQQALAREARDEDFVISATVAASVDDDGVLSIAGAITLVDGLTYSLEVSVSEAAAALEALGGTAT